MWIKAKKDYYECSNCGSMVRYHGRHCAHCGYDHEKKEISYMDWIIGGQQKWLIEKYRKEDIEDDE